MNTPLLAVMIHDRPEPLKTLEGALSNLLVESYSVKSCSEAKSLIAQYQPLVVFVDLLIWSKSFPYIVDLAKAADQGFNIIVVGALPDIEQYVSAVERGAFNYIAPPFSHDTLTMALHSASVDARERRESLARVFYAHVPV